MALNLIMIVCLSFAWATAFPWIKIAVMDLGPLTIVAGRLAVGAVVLMSYRFVLLRRIGFERAHLKPFLIMAVLGNILPFSLIAYGQKAVPSSVTALLVATVPLFTLAMAHLALRKEEPVTPLKVLGGVLAVAGVIVLMLPHVDPGALGGSLLPYLLVLAGTACYGFMNVYGRLSAVTIDPTTLATGMVVWSAVLALPLALVVEQPWHTPGTAAAWQAVLGLGLIPTALATILYFPTLKRGGALAGAIAGNLVPVFGVLLSAMLVGEVLTRELAFGAALILVGMLFIQPGLCRKVLDWLLPQMLLRREGSK
jgi:drug/metabolite transporter (DMT)-like permease